MKELKAIFFDQDGTIIDTERDGHRIAFNKAFSEFGFDVEWDVETYYGLLKVAGGKERMKHYLHTVGFGREVKPEEEDQLIKDLHKRKTAIFIDLIKSGSLPLRPGIHRLMKEANEKGVVLCVCTTAAPESANAVADTLLPDIMFAHILAGDVIANKKPAPDIYHLAMEKTGFSADQCVAVEDSRTGLKSGKAAGLPVVITTSIYTAKEDFTEADLVVNRLGDKDESRAELIQGDVGGDFDGEVTLAHIKNAIS